MTTVAPVLALVSLAACLLAPVAYFLGSLGEDTMKGVFLASSLVWFVSVSIWTTRSRIGKEDR